MSIIIVVNQYSTSALIVPPTRLSTVGDRAFPTAASRICNSLPLHVTSAPSLQTCRRRGWSHCRSAAVSRPNLLLFFGVFSRILNFGGVSIESQGGHIY